MSRDNSLSAQKDRLKRQINHWRVLSDTNKDFILLGDTNLCAKSWYDQSYDKSELASMVIDFMLEESCVQLIEVYTRSELVNNILHRSCIDHIITNIPTKCNSPTIEAIGDTDHMSILSLIHI